MYYVYKYFKSKQIRRFCFLDEQAYLQKSLPPPLTHFTISNPTYVKHLQYNSASAGLYYEATDLSKMPKSFDGHIW